MPFPFLQYATATAVFLRPKHCTACTGVAAVAAVDMAAKMREARDLDPGEPGTMGAFGSKAVQQATGPQASAL